MVQILERMKLRMLTDNRYTRNLLRFVLPVKTKLYDDVKVVDRLSIYQKLVSLGVESKADGLLILRKLID